MTILFESYIFPETLLNVFKAKSKVGLDFAAHNLSKAIYTGLKNNRVNVRVVNAPNIGSFPAYYKSPIVPGVEINDGKSIPFLNVAFLKRYDIRRRICRAINNELRYISTDEDVTLLLYNFRCLPFLRKLKKKWPLLKVLLLVTDLPWNTTMAPSVLTRVGKHIVGTNNNLKQEYLQYVDGYVLLAPGMKDAIGIGEKPWMHMEGIYESDSVIRDTEKEPNKVILYTGNLSRKYGIMNLLDAFSMIPGKEYRLWFRGGGDCKDAILDRAKNDDRIKILPPLTREELLCLQKKATVLVNPVGPSQGFTHLFFPSKTLEYLASGTPVLMYHLSCMPKEYDDYLFYIEHETPEGIKDKIVEVCTQESGYLRELGLRATSFVINNKTPIPQTKKIIDFINSISQ